MSEKTIEEYKQIVDKIRKLGYESYITENDDYFTVYIILKQGYNVKIAAKVVDFLKSCGIDYNKQGQQPRIRVTICSIAPTWGKIY